jgi:hypothetical protein
MFLSNGSRAWLEGERAHASGGREAGEKEKRTEKDEEASTSSAVSGSSDGIEFRDDSDNVDCFVLHQILQQRKLGCLYQYHS